MKRRFEEILAECLEAVTTGQRTIEECLALHPQWSAHLEPLLRFGARLDQASFPEPDPAFTKAARDRFLAAVQGRAWTASPRRRLPSLPTLPALGRRLAPATGWRRAAAAMTAAVLIAFVGFSSFVVASAGDTVPGDWRYPVKRFTERTRLTFTFGEDARRGYRIRLAEERLEEVQKLASEERRISESVLRQLVNITQPLLQTLEPASVPADQIERITELTAKQKDILDSVAPLVVEEAVDELEEARVVSSEGHERAVQALAAARSQPEPPEELPGLTTPAAGAPTAEAGASPSPTAEGEPEASPTTEASATPEQGSESEASATPSPEPTSAPTEATPVPGEPTPQPPSPTATPAPPERQVVFLPGDTTAGITWNLMIIGDFSVRVPADGEEDWAVSTLRGSSGETIFVGHRWSGRFDAAIAVNVNSGEASIHVLLEGVVRRVEADEVRSLVPRPVADVIFHVLESINAGPQ